MKSWAHFKAIGPTLSLLMGLEWAGSASKMSVNEIHEYDIESECRFH